MSGSGEQPACDAAGRDVMGQPACNTHGVPVIPESSGKEGYDVYRCGDRVVGVPTTPVGGS